MKTFQAEASQHLAECLSRPSVRDGMRELLLDHVDHVDQAAVAAWPTV